MDISDKIKELRKKTGLSQSKFSAKFGIPVRTLQQWEQGISAPPGLFDQNDGVHYAS